MRLARSAALAAVVASFLPPVALGHGSVQPTLATPASTQDFTFVVANARDDSDMVGFTVDVPEGATLVDAAAERPLWVVSSSGTSAEWRGGPVPPRGSASFRLRATLPDRTGTVDFLGRELYADGPGPSFRLGVVLAGGPTTSEVRDEGARTLGKAALFVALAALVLAGAGFFLGLSRWLKGPREAPPRP